MLPRHADVYSTLTPAETAHLWSAVLAAGLADPREPAPSTGVEVPLRLADLSHGEVVLTLATDTTEVGMTVVEKLIERPIYMCARGETGEVFLDVHGHPISTPLGHRRGAPVAAPRVVPPGRPHPRTTPALRDHRVLSQVLPNPKRPGSAAHARYAIYRVGMTVDEALAAGVTRADVRWDAKMGFIVLVMP